MATAEGSSGTQGMVGGLVEEAEVVVGMGSGRRGLVFEREVVAEDSLGLDMVVWVAGRGSVGGCCFDTVDRVAVAVQGIDIDSTDIADIGHMGTVGPWLGAEVWKYFAREEAARETEV